MREKSREGKRVFVSYAHEDDDLRKELEKHLSLLKRQHLIQIWHDQDIHAGAEWEREIQEHLSRADIILLLISPDFLASEYCFSAAMKHTMERHERGDAHVIPIIARPVDWQNAPFGKLQPLPTGAKPIRSSQWGYEDEAFYDVVVGIRKVIEASLEEEGQPHYPLLYDPAPTDEKKWQQASYNVYICYHEADESEVMTIAHSLEARGIMSWLDLLEVKPGTPEMRQQQRQIERIPTAAICVGKQNIMERQELQMYAFLAQFYERELPVIPVILASAPAGRKLPPYLDTFGRVDFRRSTPDPLQQLVWGITGKRPF